MKFVMFCNSNLGFMSVILTVGLLLCATAQCYYAYSQRKTELYKFKIKHIESLQEHWNEINKNFKYIKGYKAEFNGKEGYKQQLDELKKFINEHLLLTKFYFGHKLYIEEESFINALIKVLPDAYFEGCMVAIEPSEFDNVHDLYDALYEHLLKKTI